MKSSKKNIIVSAITVIALCFSLMIGGTYAWFTDEVSSSVCTVESGTLRVGLEMKDDNGEWVDANGKTLMFKVGGAIAPEGTKILWEPGCTYELPELRVINKGNLALKYKVIVSGVKGDAELNEVITWTIGENAVSENVKLLPGEAKNFVIKGHMLETAGNNYQGLTISGIGIKVLATQVSHESDSKDSNYDGQLSEFTFRDGVVGSVTNDASADGGYGVIYADSGAQVTVNANITAEESFDNYAMAVWADGEGTKVVINGGDFTQKITGTDNQYDLVYASGGAQIEINGGSFKVGAGDPKWTLNCRDNCGSVITVKGGKFYKFDPSAPRAGQADEVVVPEDYTVVKVGDWYKVVKKDGANIEITKQDDANITVSEDVSLSNVITISESKVTLDVSGKTISNTTDLWDEGKNAWSLISAREKSDLTVVGGNFVAKENDCFAVDVQDGSIVTIKDGKFVGNIHAVYVFEGKAIIEGGFYDIQQKNGSHPYGFVLNCYDANRAAGTAKIIVKGGTFVNFNPADCWAEGEHTNFVADGYKVVSETKANGEIWYTVVAE